MGHNLTKWDAKDFSMAMKIAIESNCDHKFIRADKSKILFNGFWRNGDKQNVCLWLDKGTWHDAKTGDGGGCKEFAKTAFNLTLHEFMNRFGSSLSQSIAIDNIFQENQRHQSVGNIDLIWHDLLRLDNAKQDLAAEWLISTRGFESPRFCIRSGFANLNKSHIDIFDQQHQGFIKQRLSLGPQLIAPIRGVSSNQVRNLLFRAIGDVPKEEKTRLLTGAGGWHEIDGSPRSFGFPHLIKEFPHLILCEGMADYFTAEQILDCDHKFLPIGAASASALPKWANWLAGNKFNGCVTIIFHIDKDRNGNLSDSGTGQDNAIKCINQLREAGIKAKLFPWLKFMKRLNEFIKIRDLADSLKIGLELSQLKQVFLNVLQEDTYND